MQGEYQRLEWPPLRSGHIQRKNYFYICKLEKSADFSNLLFHGRGRNGKRHLLALAPCGSIAPAGKAQIFPARQSTFTHMPYETM
ncbi:hypothetical protein RX411_05630 [Faecalibacterium prausnitzii]|jgi:hypothetical protein|nr:hypothetical protein [Faecalibacterium prausnitzii]